MKSTKVWTAGIAGMLALAVGFVWSGRAEDKKSASPYVHTVIFNLKKDAPADAGVKAIADAHELLTAIPSVRELRIGRPAKQSTPDFAVKDYDIGLVVLFDNFAGLKEYLEHPKHLEYVKRHLKTFDKIVVYDFENQKK